MKTACRLFSKRLNLCDSSVVEFVQSLKPLVQGFELVSTGFLICPIQICTIQIELVFWRGPEKRIVDRRQSALKPFVTV